VLLLQRAYVRRQLWNHTLLAAEVAITLFGKQKGRRSGTFNEPTDAKMGAEEMFALMGVMIE
jgi:hypothetical protein